MVHAKFSTNGDASVDINIYIKKQNTKKVDDQHECDVL